MGTVFDEAKSLSAYTFIVTQRLFQRLYAWLRQV
jgi:hypothetical protein